ncbi:MAG: BON domain-containing protein [Blastocatellia bacterium]|nr:BON domain-containing protein [Blastocatellia bacterium]
MRNMSAIICLVLLMTVVGFAQAPKPAPPQEGEQTEKAEKMEKSEKKEKREKKMPEAMSDSDIQKCINGRFASSEKLNAQGFNTAVETGVVTLTGKAINAGSKGAATRIAKSCGARSVTNNISAPAIPRPAKKGEKTEK